MILTKNDLKEYLKCDKEALGITCKYPPLFGNEVWKFQISLRIYEYFYNANLSTGGVLNKLRMCFWHFINHHYSIKLGFVIPPNTCGKGLNIHHYGCVVINKYAKIGDYCEIQQCVNIGRNKDEFDVPVIGNHVFIGPGVKLFGKIYIADNVKIGAGSIVTKSFDEVGCTICGNPARKLK